MWRGRGRGGREGGTRTECSYSCSSCAMPSIKRSLASCAVVLLLPLAAYSLPTLLVAARRAFKLPKMVYKWFNTCKNRMKNYLWQVRGKHHRSSKELYNSEIWWCTLVLMVEKSMMTSLLDILMVSLWTQLVILLSCAKYTFYHQQLSGYHAWISLNSPCIYSSL